LVLIPWLIKTFLPQWKLRSRANFIENYVELYRFDLSWAKENRQISAGSIPGVMDYQ
jgi:hypothetical protein